MRLQVKLIPAEDDQPFRKPEYQEELRRFEKSVKAQGFEVSFRIELLEAAAGDTPATFMGEFVIVAATVGPVLGGLIGAWLQARYGRKVRLKIGDVEAEAQTVEQVERLLRRAEEFGQKNEKDNP